MFRRRVPHLDAVEHQGRLPPSQPILHIVAVEKKGQGQILPDKGHGVAGKPPAAVLPPGPVHILEIFPPGHVGTGGDMDEVSSVPDLRRRQLLLLPVQAEHPPGYRRRVLGLPGGQQGIKPEKGLGARPHIVVHEHHMGDAQIGGNAGLHSPGKAAGAAGVGVGNLMNPLPGMPLPGGGIVHHKDLKLSCQGGMGVKKGASLQHGKIPLQILFPAVGADYQSQAYRLGLFRLRPIGAGAQGTAPGEHPERKLAFGAVCQGKALFFPG